MDDDSVSFTPRPSAIPRLSKLPLPKSAFSHSIRASSPTKSSSVRPVSPTLQLAPSIIQAQTLKRPTAATPRPALRHSTTQPHSTVVKVNKRPPLGQARSLQTKPSPESLFFCDGVIDDNEERPKIARNVSQQENSAYTPVDSDASPEEEPCAAVDSGSMRLPRKARPSLSERTIESLAHLPSSPASALRGSNFFTPQKSTSIRPPSFYPSSVSRPRNESSARAVSPLKQSIAQSPLKQTALPRVATLKPKVAVARALSPPKLAARPSSAASNFRTSKNYATLNSRTVGVRPSAISRPSLDSVFQTPQARKPESRTVRGVPVTEMPIAKPVQSSSAILREKVAQARAAQRKTAKKPDSAIGLSPTYNDFEMCLDTAQLGSQNPRLLNQRVDTARGDGRLNIAGLSLKHIPDEVLSMYDPASMETSTVSWYEAVDLTRFIAADNEIEGIGDGVFPDASKEALAMEEDSKGNPFAGLEVLDLHGNLLSQVPMGLRRLEQLTVLNLSRNKLDNAAFDIITQIPSLRELRLADNELCREIPSTIGSLVNLEILDVHNNRLSHLPTSLRSLVHLRHLDVSKNRFTALPMDILSSLPLTELFASHNALFAALFSSTTGTSDVFSKLQVLEVANNALAALSFESTLDFPALRRLDVSNNRLNALPDMTRWTALSVLLAEENDLQCLPQGFVGLTHTMRSASFRCNNIRLVELEVANMHALEVLSLEGNPLRDRRYLVMSVDEMKRDLLRKAEVEGEMF